MTRELDKSFSKKTIQDYEVISVLGSGAFGTCYKVRDKQTNKLYAWKAFDYAELDDVKLEALVSEITVLRQLQHPNIVQYYHHLSSHEAKSIFIIMEWCEGGDLSQLIFKARTTNKRFVETYIWRVLYQLCKALQVCHSKLEKGTVLHRDVKPANIFLDAAGNAKLGDFGLARMLRRNQSFTHTFVGTPYYMSPEIMKGARYDCRSDVWALGCLIYEMAALVPPFRGKRLQQLSANITNGKYVEISQIYSKDLQDIIHFMLEVSEKQRPCVEMVARHPNLIRNITNSAENFECLVAAEADFHVMEVSRPRRTRLNYSHSSISSANDNSFYEDATRFCDFTPDVLYKKPYKRTLQQSDPELYKSARQIFENETLPLKSIESPQKLSKNIFNNYLQNRLRAIKAHEALLKQKEENLNAMEKQLNERARRLNELELKLDKRHLSIENKLRILKPKISTEVQRSMKISTKNNRKRTSTLSEKQARSPDDTYCTIEPQDTQTPTVAKLNLTKPLPALRKVTFQSPKRIINYDIENMPPTVTAPRPNQTNKLRNSMMCNSSDGSNSDGTTQQKRKSLLSILGIKRSNKTLTTKEASLGNNVQQQEILSKCEPQKLANIWTKESKRAAFDLLATMNAADGVSTVLRQSLREPSRNCLRRDRRRHSLKNLPQPVETI